MADLFSPSLMLVLLLSSMDSPSALGSAFLFSQEHVKPASHEPHFTECVSRDQETFRCRWSPGSFHNLSSPGALRVFYLRKGSHSSGWKECPEYVHAHRECYFDANHTSVWVPYCVQLRDQNNVTYFNEEDCFTVENIVRPDPPVFLNWTLLNVSPSGLSYDVMISWKPPPSADVQAGWMRIEYEVQYREKNSTKWEALEMQPHTQQTIYGLQIGKEFEVHIRCRMQAFTKFGEFSDSVFIKVTEIPSAALESTVPLTLVLIFGVVGVLIIIALTVLFQQQRIMMILLPPVPAPKIKGIDSELLKKGKLEELNFILNGGSIGGFQTYPPDVYKDESWVEFIEADDEDAERREKEDNAASDTQKLLGPPQPAGNPRDFRSSGRLGHVDDDSGLASCLEVDLTEEDDANAPADETPPADVTERATSSESAPVALVPTGAQPTWVNTDFYAQVSNVTSSGGVVLSPGQQLRIQEAASPSEKEAQAKGKRCDEQGSGPRFQLLLVADPHGSGYTSESHSWPINTPLDQSAPGEGYQTLPPVPTEATNANPLSYILPDSPQPPFIAPVADYTVVQELDTHHSLLLNPSALGSSGHCPPQQALKSQIPVEYVTPDLLGNLLP